MHGTHTRPCYLHIDHEQYIMACCGLTACVHQAKHNIFEQALEINRCSAMLCAHLRIDKRIMLMIAVQLI